MKPLILLGGATLFAAGFGLGGYLMHWRDQSAYDRLKWQYAADRVEESFNLGVGYGHRIGQQGWPLSMAHAIAQRRRDGAGTNPALLDELPPTGLE